jgi:hypothetical protein
LSFVLLFPLILELYPVPLKYASIFMNATCQRPEDIRPSSSVYIENETNFKKLRTREESGFSRITNNLAHLDPHISYHIIANAATAPRAHPLFKVQPLFTVIAGPPAVLQVQKPVVWLPIQLVSDAVPVTGAPVTTVVFAAIVVAGTVLTAVTWVLEGSVLVSVVVAAVVIISPPISVVELAVPMAMSLRGMMTVTYDSSRLEKVKVLA